MHFLVFCNSCVVSATATCVRGRGRFYQGRVNTTKSGIPCQPWDAQEPHSHNRPPNVFPEIHDADNYCRNAGGEEPSPWCYTTDPRRRWEHCDIPQCGKQNLQASSVCGLQPFPSKNISIKGQADGPCLNHYLRSIRPSVVSLHVLFLTSSCQAFSLTLLEAE